LGLVCFADESGSPVHCTVMCMSIICFERRPGVASHMHGYEAWTSVRRLLGWRRGELKYRGVRRAAERRGIGVEEVLSHTFAAAVLAAGCCVHVEEAPRARPGLVEAVAGLVPGGSTVFLDNEALPGGLAGARRLSRRLGVWLRFADSARTPGVQLADILAGYLREEGVMGCRVLLDRVGRG